MSGARPLYPRKQTFVIAAARLDLECIATPPLTNLEASSPLGVRLLTNVERRGYGRW